MRLATVVLLGIFILTGCTIFGTIEETQTYDHTAAVLTPSARIVPDMINESSAIVKSQRFENTYWTLNDSGDSPRIFALREDGTLISPEGSKGYNGISIVNAQNSDWEDMALDNAGHLYIADSGNNINERRDLVIYQIPEPDPTKQSSSQPAIAFPFHYPDQKSFPPEQMNFDGEALFWSAGHLYLLTKHRSDTHTKLYRFDTLEPDRDLPLTLLGEYEMGDMVTAADTSPDGRQLAVLTRSSVWLFEVLQPGDFFFKGKAYKLQISAGQCEGICIDGNLVRITNEQRDIFLIPLNTIRLHPNLII